MKTNPEFIARDIAGELVLVPVGSAAKTCKGLTTCNEVGAFIWKTLEKDMSIDELVTVIVAEFDVDEATAKSDAVEFTDRLKALGALI